MNLFFRLFSLVLLITFLQFSNAEAQKLAGDQRVNEIIKLVEKDSVQWLYGAGIGLDMRSLLLINPRVGAGQSQIGFGFIFGGLANYTNDKLSWHNTTSIQLAAQKIGLGSNTPWIKNMDIFRINSKLSYEFESDEFSNAIDFTLQSILLPAYSGNHLRPRKTDDKLIGTLFSPATINFSPGFEYLPNKKYNFLISPAAFKGIFILNQDVANLNIFNTEPVLGEMGDTLRFSRSDLRFGTFARASFKDSFFEDNFKASTTLDLFSNYLRDPENIDILWRAEFSYLLFKNISLNLNTEFFYDNDVLVQVDREGTLGLSSSFTSALYVKYNHIF